MTGRTTCARCGAPYLSRLVGWRCPLCATPDPDREAVAPRGWDDADDRLLAIVAAATIANVLLLSVLAVYVLR